MKVDTVSRYNYSVKAKKQAKNNIRFGMNYSNPVSSISLNGDISSIKTFMPSVKTLKDFLIEYFNSFFNDNVVNGN